MPIKAKSKDMVVHVDPLSLTASLQILQGNNVQTFNVETKEFAPDRSLTHCEIVPSVVVHDPEGMISGARPVTSCEWYEGNTRITNDANYELRGTSLLIKKNFPEEQPVEIRCVFTFTDARSNQAVQVERSMPFYTAVYDDTVLRLAMDKPISMTVDPMTLSQSADEPWWMTINAQLYAGKIPVPDSEAAYLWEIYDHRTKVWRDFSDHELRLLLSDPKDAYGHFRKSLKVDMRFVKHYSFRCFATKYKGEYPTKVNDTTVKEAISVKVDMQHTLRAEVVQTAGVKVNSALSTMVAFDCLISNQYGPVPEDRLFLFRVKWYAKSGKPGSSPVYLGVGKQMAFVPKDYQFDNLYAISVYADVELYRNMVPVTDTNGRVITSSNKVLISTIYQ